MGGMTRRSAFAERLRGTEPLCGVFQKTPHHQVTELLGQTEIDFAVLDAEHAPFDPSQLDSCMLASTAVDLPLLVRVARNAPDPILAALDMGASGVFVPHVACPDDAARAVRAAKYISGGRGFSPSTRAGDYGRRGLRPYMEAADGETAMVFQIEDAGALDHLAAIAGTPGAAGLFVGRADLAASMDVDWNDPRLDEATREIASAARAAGIACGAFLADAARAVEFRAWGVNFLVVGSDQSALKADVARTVRALAEPETGNA